MFAQIQSLRASLNNIITNLKNLGPTPPHRPTQVIPNQEPQIPIIQKAYLNNRNCENVKSDPPNFDGSLEPDKFLNWLNEFENYCEHHQMEDDRRVGLAKMKLEGHARNFWRNQERLFRRQLKDQSITWAEMKRNLRDQYIPHSYQHQMMDEWSHLKQGSQSITNYIAQFQDYIFRCGVEEDEIVTLARFKSGLHEDLRRKYFLK